MRYFLEDKTYIGEAFDSEKYTQKDTETNHIRWDWIVTKEAKTKEVVDWESDDGKSKQTHTVIISPEEGHWGYADSCEFPSDDLEPPADSNSHDNPYESDEEVTILRELTEEELEKREDELIKSAAQAEASKLKQAAIDSAVENEIEKVVINSDNGLVAIYEVTPTTNDITNTTPFCEAYARKMMRLEISLRDVPDELQDETLAIYQAMNLTTVQTLAYNVKFSGFEHNVNKNFKKGRMMASIITPNADYRVPTLEELPNKSEFVCQGVEKFFERYCLYTPQLDGTALLNVVMPEESNTIRIKIRGISLSNKKSK